MIMVVFSSISAAMSFAMAIPQFRAEVNAWFGRTTTLDAQKPDRALQFVFLMFCYSSPLLMAGFVGLLSYVIQKVTSWRVEEEEAE
jgi:hypothetical protein